MIIVSKAECGEPGCSNITYEACGDCGLNVCGTHRFRHMFSTCQTSQKYKVNNTTICPGCFHYECKCTRKCEEPECLDGATMWCGECSLHLCQAHYKNLHKHGDHMEDWERNLQKEIQMPEKPVGYRDAANTGETKQPFQYHLFFVKDDSRKNRITHIEFERYEEMEAYIQKHAEEWHVEGIVPYYVNGTCSRIQVQRAVSYSVKMADGL